jgi:hypothetical protein
MWPNLSIVHNPAHLTINSETHSPGIDMRNYILLIIQVLWG